MQDDTFPYVRFYNVHINLFLQTVPTNISPAIQCTDYSPHFAVLNNSYHHMPLYKVPLYFPCRPLSGTGRLLKGFLRAFSSLHTLNNPSSLSLFSQGRGSSLLTMSVALLGSGGPWPICAGPCAPLAWGPRAEHCPAGGVSEEENLWAELSPLTCWPCCFCCSPGCDWFLGSEWTSTGHIQFFIHQTPSSPPLQGYSQSKHCSALGLPSPMCRTLSLGSLNFLRFAPAHFCPVQVPLCGLPSL